jgi:hypothetical protein
MDFITGLPLVDVLNESIRLLTILQKHLIAFHVPFILTPQNSSDSSLITFTVTTAYAGLRFQTATVNSLRHYFENFFKIHVNKIIYFTLLSPANSWLNRTYTPHH